MKHVDIYTDGACKGNPGPGGWGAILVYKANEKELSGGARETTNNRMELLAAIEALKKLKEPCEVHLTSDSSYLVKGATEWLDSWIQKKWKDVKNVDLWMELIPLLHEHQVTFTWVKGHNGHPYNERCDQLATSFAETFLEDMA